MERAVNLTTYRGIPGIRPRVWGDEIKRFHGITTEVSYSYSEWSTNVGCFALLVCSNCCNTLYHFSLDLRSQGD